MNKKLFYKYVSELVYFEATKANRKYQDIAILLDVSESFIQKVHNQKYDQHYNLEHLYIISDSLNIDINELLPNKKTLKKIFGNKVNIEEKLNQIKGD